MSDCKLYRPFRTKAADKCLINITFFTSESMIEMGRDDTHLELSDLSKLIDAQ
jgi:hypothetical protein